MTPVKLTILGSGNSSGVPAAGNDWGACDPNEPKNRRMRTSLAVQSDTTTLVIDTGPDFSAQMTRANIKTLDAVLITHEHSDHINGLDDIRIYFLRQGKTPIPIYTDGKTVGHLTERFPYIFEDDATGLYPKIAKINEIKTIPASLTIGDIRFQVFQLDHGTTTSLGFRFGDIGYCTDMRDMDEQAVQILSGVKTLIVDGAGYQNLNNPAHANIPRLVALNQSIQAQHVYITALPPFMDYERTNGQLPDRFECAYDMLVFQTECP